jgi:acyl carrier protein
MDREPLLRAFESIVDVPANSLSGRELLSDLGGWDSFAILSLIALADEKFRVNLSVSDIEASRTVNDLLFVIAERTD